MTDQTSIEQPPAEQATEGAPPSAASPPGPTRGRRYLVNGVVVLASVLGVVGMVAIFANRLLFDPGNWSTTSTQLLQNPTIRTATSNYLVDQLYANVNVPQLLKNELPAPLNRVADPLAGALRNVAVQGANYALSTPPIQALWAKANLAAAQSFKAVVNGGTRHVAVNQGEVTLNLNTIVDDLAARLGLPANISSKLPPSVARLTVFKAKQLKLVQDIGKAVQGLALALTIAVPLLYALALVLAGGRRRRTLMNVGFAIAFVGVVGLAIRALLKSYVTNQLVKDEAFRPAVHAVLDIMTQILGEITIGFLFVGIVAALGAWFAGPAHPAVVSRRWIAPFLRDHPYATYGIVAFVLLLIFIWQPFPATGTLIGIIVFSVLAALGTEVLRRQTAVEFPASHGDQPAPAV